MSTDLTGDAAIGRAIMTDAQAQLDARQAEAEQLDLLDPITPEDIWDAREALGETATPQQVAHAARAKKRGRPAGSRNRRTDDLEKWLLAQGQHPAVTLMQIQSTAPEVLMEASKRRKVHSFQKDGTANVVVEHMTYEAAQSLRARCADMLMPYLVGKKPLKVDMSFSGVADLIIEGVTHTAGEIGDIIDAEFAPAPSETDGGDA
ncbi:hypothetical protein ASE65_10235 [Sphingomonas sp. Leaf16]|nr:hypothetical protein ASE65_10235 [Sphingomonas sp. Leaf16]KQN11473.1 hypothetical protein ASE81_11220 [Sphingomonas sp. Leaf29]KQN18795.1 hypothetical protein ASE83_11160 [Sphingomonas sp. Leaf32]